MTDTSENGERGTVLHHCVRRAKSRADETLAAAAALVGIDRQCHFPVSGHIGHYRVSGPLTSGQRVTRSGEAAMANYFAV